VRPPCALRRARERRRLSLPPPRDRAVTSLSTLQLRGAVGCSCINDSFSTPVNLVREICLALVISSAERNESAHLGYRVRVWRTREVELTLKSEVDPAWISWLPLAPLIAKILGIHFGDYSSQKARDQDKDRVGAGGDVEGRRETARETGRWGELCSLLSLML
jgi:hypothetical protein